MDKPGECVSIYRKMPNTNKHFRMIESNGARYNAVIIEWGMWEPNISHYNCCCCWFVFSLSFCCFKFVVCMVRRFRILYTHFQMDLSMDLLRFRDERKNWTVTKQKCNSIDNNFLPHSIIAWDSTFLSIFFLSLFTMGDEATATTIKKSDSSWKSQRKITCTFMCVWKICRM